MSESKAPASPADAGRNRAAPVWRWTMLLAISAVLVSGLEWLKLPAALLLGPMVAAILLVSFNFRARVAQPLFYLAQGMIGCLMASFIPASIFGEVAADWPIFAAGVLSVIAVAALIGFLLTKWQLLPGTTAIWGSAPGAAAAMVFMGEAYGADVRLIAFMQYLRVVCVALTASTIARLFLDESAMAAVAATVWFPPIDWLAFAETLALAAGGTGLALLLKIPAGPLLVPMVLGIVFREMGWMSIELPPWLLAMSYALIGWSIGLRFTRDILKHAARALPGVLGSIVTLIVICGGFGLVLHLAAGVDPLTAYLATSPGGADSVAIISASSDVDVPFVMAMQTARFIVVLITGPPLARFIANRMGTGMAALKD